MTQAQTDAQTAAETWDCTYPNCPREATKKGPGGKPYCDHHRAQIYAKKVTTTTNRHGTAGGGGHARLLVDTERAELDVDALTRRLRVEAKAVERASRSPRAARLLPERKREVTLTIRELAVRLASLQPPASPDCEIT